jgi:hypothetical protein
MKGTAIALTAGLALLAYAATASAQNGGRVPPAPIPLRVISADAIVIGKLGKVEEKTVAATGFPGAKAKVDYRVLELKVGEALRGAKKGDVIRFGFLLLKADRNGPGPRTGISEDTVYVSGQECLFFLYKHHDESFYISPSDYPSIDKKQESYAKALELTRRCLKLWEDPKASLKAKEAEDRLLAAGMLIRHYRWYRPGKYGPETEPLSAEESRLLLNILADADWPTEVPPGNSLPFEMTPGPLFSQLDVTFKDGWTSPDGGYAVLYAAAKRWVKDHANTYRIQRFTPAAAKKPDAKDKKD